MNPPASDPVPQVSVVIPTFNRRAILERTLAPLFEQDFPPEQYEIIVVDDGSTDGTGEWLRSLHPTCGWKVVGAPNRGPATARNRGIAESRGAIVLFLDDDILCDRNVVSAHWKTHKARNSPAIVFGPLRLIAESSALAYAAGEFLDLQAENAVAADAGLRQAYLGPNRSIPRSVLLEHGGFDESYPFIAEDRELGLRLWTAGMPFVSCPSASAAHSYARTSREFLERIAGAQGEAEVRLCRSHPQSRPFSTLAKLGRHSWKDRAYALAARHPRSIDPVLGAMQTIGEITPGLRKLGARAFEVRQLGRFLAGAAQAAGSWEALEAEFGRRVSFLMYHDVSTRSGLGEWNVPPARFREHMRALADEGFQAIALEDWIAWVRDTKPLPPRPVVLTFDDGYADLNDNVFPVLEEHGFKAVVYIVTEQVGGKNQWDIGKGYPEVPLMRAEDIAHWAARGVEFGSHSCTHADLTTLPDPELEREIVASATTLMEVTGRKVASFAYPHGRYDDRVLRLVRQTYPSAVSSRYGIASLAGDRYLIERNPVWNVSTAKYAVQIATKGEHPALNLRAFAKRMAQTVGLR
jgi:peptidoglycan/xylan/chitin deacetylase (PgdA/CDA1 family)/GT2 family glycosyltransferase